MSIIEQNLCDTLPYLEDNGFTYKIGSGIYVYPKWKFYSKWENSWYEEIFPKFRGRIIDKKVIQKKHRGKYYRSVTDYKIKYIIKDDNLTRETRENWFNIRYREVFYWAGILFDDFFQTRTYLYLDGKKFGYMDCV